MLFRSRPASVDAWLPALRALVQRGLDLDLLMRIARSAPDLAAEPWSAGPGSAPPLMAAVRPGGSGLGLMGMRERVSALGGRLSAGPRDGGGFQVRAEIPAEIPAP